MRKFFRKFLIYLLAFGMLCPAWLATGVLKATKVKASDVNLAAWDFNNSSTDPNIDLFHDADFDNGSGYSSSYVTGNGESGKAYSSSHWDRDEYYQVEFATIGYKDIRVSFWDKSSPSGPKQFKVEYSTHHDNFTELAESYTDINSDFTNHVFDFSSIAALDNRYDVKIRFQLTGSEASNYGTWTIDDIYVSATAGDLPSGTIGINSGNEFSNETNVDLQLTTAGDFQPIQMKLSNDSDLSADGLNPTSGQWKNFSSTINDWKIASGDGVKTVYAKFKDKNGNYSDVESDSIVLDTIAPQVTVDSLTTNKKTPVVTGTVDDSEAGIIANVNGVDYTGVNNGDGTWSASVTSELIDGTYDVLATATDLAGNEGQYETSNELIISTVAPTAPVISASVTDKTIKLTWNSVEGAVKYHVYLKSKINGAVILDDTAASVDAPVVEYQNNVASYGEYYAVVTAEDALGNISAIPAEADQYVVKVTAPAPVAVTTAPVATPVVETPAPAIGPAKAQAAAPVENKVETPADDSNGQIKGDETKDEEDDKTNWTPWIVLFVLIILAGAATGGYFYWFNGEEEVKTVVRETKKEEVKKDNVKTGKKSNNQKKQKRW